MVDEQTPDNAPNAPDAVDADVAEAAAAAAAAAEAAAFAKVIAANHDDMLRVAFVVSLDIEIAREAVPAAWAKVWRDRLTPRPPERLRPWIMAVAATEARGLAGLGGRGGGVAVAGDTGLPATRAAAAPAYPADELRLANALAGLDSHDRMIVGLRYVAGLSAQELVVELAMPEGAVQARLARILARLLQDLHGAPTETIDAYEQVVTERVRSFGDRALAPFDADDVAKTAIETVPPPTVADRLGGLLERAQSLDRRAWMAAAGVLVVVVVFGVLGRSGAIAPLATPIPTDATRNCELAELELRVTKWEGEPAHRSASVEMKNVSKGACFVDSLPEPWLVDGAQIALVMGQDQPSAPMRIGPGDVLRTQVGVRNYCGPFPKPPVTVAFRQGTTILIATPPSADDVSGLPTCLGQPSSTNDIGMRAWAP